nr:hypothetical protein [Pedobacter sp. ASV2]
METNQIRIDDLQKAIILLLSNFKTNIGDVIEIQNDFYWDIPSKELYNPYEEPKQLTLGQLSDDMNEVKRLTDEPSSAISYDLKRISNIIKAMSIENPIAF